jgi:NAD(P)-dependent dehydrogenase (short-subunit alcohol dehydrogenase family)
MNKVLRNSFMVDIAVIGANGTIGSQFVELLSKRNDVDKLYAVSRSLKKYEKQNIIPIEYNPEIESSIKDAVQLISEQGKLDLVIVATGILHFDENMPEKAISHISKDYMQKVFEVNTILPALIMKEFLPLLKKDKKAVFALLSARVGSISDNYMGGWYSYRASKTALNMLIKSASIEMKRKNKDSVVIGLHPGTVDSDLSKPFQANVKEHKLFSPENSVSQMIDVIENIDKKNSGSVIAYDGEVLEP